MQRALIILLLVGIGIATFSVVSHRRARSLAAQQAAWEQAKADRAAELGRANNEKKRTAPTIPPVTEPKIEPLAPAAQATLNTTAVVNASPPAAGPSPSARAPQRRQQAELQDPVARAALSLVGIDPDADEIWVDAINNPALNPKELEDLIEDLNEEGFEDPKNLRDDELELVWRRLVLVEEHFPLPDDVRYPHFLEVYKDLHNMLARGTGQ